MMGKMKLGPKYRLKIFRARLPIADYAGRSAQLGVGAGIHFVALISISLGILI